MLLHKLTVRFLQQHALQAAHVLEKQSPQQLGSILSNFDPSTAAQAARYLSTPQLVKALQMMSPVDAGSLFAEFPLDTQLVIWHSAHKTMRESFGRELPEKQLKLLKRLTRFPPDSAASLMDPVVFSVPYDKKVGEALELASQYPDAVRFYVYVVDREQHLTGVLTLRQMIKAPQSALTKTLMEKRICKIQASVSKKEVLEHPDWQRFHSLPVVDDDNILIGVIRYATWRREMARASSKDKDPVWDTLLALGELYWSGMSETVLGSSASQIQHKENRDVS